MDMRVGDVAWHYEEHGQGRPVLVLHGAGVDHRETEACFEPALEAYGGLRRIYPDLPGFGKTTAPATLRSADDVVAVLASFLDATVGPGPVLLVGHSAGAYYCQGLAERVAARLEGLALICPLLPESRDVPEHRPVTPADDLGDDAFRSYFVVQTTAMLDRYERFVAPAAALVDAAAMERIGERWQLTTSADDRFAGPTLIVAGRQDSTVGYAAATDLLDRYAHASLAVLDGAGHALPHEQPSMLSRLLHEWLDCSETPGTNADDSTLSQVRSTSPGRP